MPGPISSKAKNAPVWAAATVAWATCCKPWRRHDDLVTQLEAEFDREILTEAMARVRLRVAPQTWSAFTLTALDGLSGADAAVRIPMQVAQVFVAKRRVQKMLQEEIAKLEK